MQSCSGFVFNRAIRYLYRFWQLRTASLMPQSGFRCISSRIRESVSDWGPACRLPTWIPFLLPSAMPSSRSLKLAEASRSRFAIISQPFFPGLATWGAAGRWWCSRQSRKRVTFVRVAPKVIPRIGLKSEDGVEGQNDETCDLWLLGCPRSCDIQNLNRGLRQPIFEPLSDVLIAGRQMNPRLVMLLRELGRFSSIRPSYSLAFVNYRIIESR